MKSLATPIIAIIVAVVMITGILTPIIIEATTETESIDNEGAGWIRYAYIESGEYSVSVNVNNGTSSVTNGSDVQEGSTDSVIYADSEMAIWVQSGKAYMTGVSEENVRTALLNDSFSITRTAEGIIVDDGEEYAFGSPSWAYVPLSSGAYGFFPDGTPVQSDGKPAVEVGEYAQIGIYNGLIPYDLPLIRSEGENGVSWIKDDSSPEETPAPLGSHAIRVGNTDEEEQGNDTEPIRGLSAVPTPTYTDGDWGFRVSSTGYATIVSYSGTGGNLVVPSTVTADSTTYTVSGIGIGSSGYPILDNDSVSEFTLTISEGIRSINGSAFEGCTKLQGPLTFPSSVTMIGENAFKGCSNLTGTLDISRVQYPGSRAFSGTGITSIILHPSVSIGAGAFMDCTGLTGTLTLTSTQYAASSSFSGTGYSEVSSVNMYNSMFINMPNLKKATVGALKPSCFSSCPLLESVTVTTPITEIPSQCFYMCSSLDFDIPDTVTTIGHSAFYGAGLQGVLRIPDGVQAIEKGTFYNNTGITAVQFGSGLTRIGPASYLTGLTGAFEKCTGITSLSFPGNVPTISWGTFKDCTGLKELYIGEGVEVIEGGTYRTGAFENCGSIETPLILPESVTNVNSSAFRGCSKIPSLIVLGDPVFESNTLSSTYMPLIKEVLNLGDSEITTTSYGLDADSVQDHVDSIGFINIVSLSESSTKEGGIYTLLQFLPIVIAAGIAIGGFTMLIRSGRP